MAKASNKEFYNKLRMQQLSGINTSSAVNESKNNGVSSLEEYKRTDNGEAYGIVKENHNYFIKKTNKQGNLDVADFAYIGGNANSSRYRYGSLGEAQKNMRFVVQSINEAFSLGGVYNKLDESVSENPSLNVKDDIGSFLKGRISQGKKNIAESTEKKFKTTFTKTEEASTKRGLMNETATNAIARALGKLNETALTTQDSESKASAPEVAADKFGTNHNVSSSDQVTADSEISDKDRVDNKSGKEKPQAPVNDSNAKSKADKGYSQPSDLSTSDSEIADGDVMSNKKDKKEKPDAPVNDTNAKTLADKAMGKGGKVNESETLVTADSELDASSSLANQDNAGKENAQAPINDTNAKAEAEKAMAKSGGDNVTPENTSGEEDIVAESVSGGDESDPFEKNPEGGSKDESTADSDQTDADRIDNEKDVEKPQSHDTHYNPEMGHKEERGEELKPKESKKDIVAESDLSTADSEINPADSPVNDKTGDMTYEKPALHDGTSEHMDDNAIAEDEMDGGDEVAAAAQALGDLGVEAPEEEPAIDAEVPADEPAAEEPVEEPASAEEPEMDAKEEPEVSDDGVSDKEEGDSMKNMKKYAGKLGNEMDSEEHDPEDIAEIISQIFGHAESDIAKLEPEKKKELADKVLKAKGTGESVPEDGGEEAVAPAENGESVETGMDKDAETAIDNEIDNLEQKDEGVHEETCSECGTFESYAESRGYSLDELAQAAVMEMANLVSGFAKAYGEGKNDGDKESVAKYMSDDIANEVKEYGHEGYVKEMQDGGLSFGMHEPTVPPEMEEELENPEKADLDDDGEISDYEEARGKAIEKNMDENSQDMYTIAKGAVDKGHGNIIQKSLDVLLPLAQKTPETIELIQSYQKALGLPVGVREGEESEPFSKPEKAGQEKGDIVAEEEMGHVHVTKGDAKQQPESEPFEKKEKAGQEKGDIVAEEETPFGKVAEVMGGGVVKPESAEMQVEEVSESEKKVRNYVRAKLEELAGKRKPSLQENEKSDKMKELDRLIETQWKLYGETIKEKLT